jgi:hypothetical protein
VDVRHVDPEGDAVSRTEKFLLALDPGMMLTIGGKSFRCSSASYSDVVVPPPRDITPGTYAPHDVDTRRFFPRKVEPRYPGEGNRLARRTAKAKRRTP